MRILIKNNNVNSDCLNIIKVHSLTVEYVENPLGIMTDAPRFAWKIDTTTGGKVQSAYRILVSKVKEKLSNNFGEIWDSGRVDDINSISIPFSGFHLESCERYFWKVKVWDKDGIPSAWSDITWWQMGVTDKSGWKARWITRPFVNYKKWVDYNIEVDITIAKAAGGVLFRAADEKNFYFCQIDTEEFALKTFIMENGITTCLKKVSIKNIIDESSIKTEHRLRIEIAEDNFTTYIDGQEVDISADSCHKSGTIGFITENDKQEARFNRLRVYDKRGYMLYEDMFYDPNVFCFSKGTVAENEKGLAVWGDMVSLCQNAVPKDSPLFRKAFSLNEEVARATAYVASLGWYELFLNGCKVEDRVLTPAVTQYAETALYDIYDVTDCFRIGQNAIGLWLGNGYNGNYSRWGWKNKEDKKVFLQVEILLKNGERIYIVSDDSWKTAFSPIKSNDIYNGETFDGRLIKKGWNIYGYNDSGWDSAEVTDGPGGELLPNLMKPIKVTQQIKPVTMNNPKKDVYVYDFGQNFSGWVALEVEGNAGSRVVIRYSEHVGDNGRINPWTNRNSEATDIYILNGEGREIYEPRFTYHGFRFVEITGYPGVPSLDSVTGCVVHSDVTSAGSFTTSNGMLNKIQSNIRWSLISNMMSIPTDCCQRDERTPCLMDSAVSEETAIYNFDMHGFYSKWIHDVKAQLDNPDWSNDIVLLPWYLYSYYGDRRILEKYYGHMVKYIGYLCKKAPDLIFTEGFGDWCPPNTKTWDSYHREKEIVNTALFYKMALVVSSVADLLSKYSESRYYMGIATKTRDVFNQRFLKENSYGSGSQTANIIPLAFDMVPCDKQKNVLKDLVNNIVNEHGGHLDTGIYATKYLLEVLADNGCIDIAYDIINKTTYPSFGYQIGLGATTLWEQWYEKGPMESHNHHMFSGIGASFYSRIAGIRPLSPGYGKISIKPYIPKKLVWVNATVETIRGTVVSKWSKQNNKLTLETVIPSSSTGVIYIPAKSNIDVSIINKQRVENDSIKFLKDEDGYSTFEVKAGRYIFKVDPWDYQCCR